MIDTEMQEELFGKKSPEDCIHVSDPGVRPVPVSIIVLQPEQIREDCEEEK